VSELKPCPFCGSEAKVFESRNNIYVVVCQEPDRQCNAGIPYCRSEQDAIEQWTRRTPDAAKLVGLLRKARESLVRYMTGDLLPAWRETDLLVISIDAALKEAGDDK
jgi:Lar family restriction alleviation protein